MRREKREGGRLRSGLIFGATAASVGVGVWLSQGALDVVEPEAVTAEAAAKAMVRENLGKLPLSFEANRGQTDRAVNFVARGSSATVWLTDDAAVFGFSADGKAATDVLRMQFVGAGRPQVEGVHEQPTKSHYLAGEGAGIRNVPHYAEVTAKNLYPGVDLRWYGDKTKLEYDLEVAPGVDPSVVRMQMKGAEELRVREDGALEIKIGGREVVQQAPVAYQTLNGEREIVAAAFEVAGDEVGFRLGSYDCARPVVIDPALSWSTYLGGAGDETGNDVAVDNVDNSVVVVGATTSINFPLGYGHIPQAPKGGTDAYVSKIHPAGSYVKFSTYLAGSDYDEAHGVTIDQSVGPNHGNIWITGQTHSNNFPVFLATQPVRAGMWDAFVTSIDKNGDFLRSSTYLGGPNNDYGRGIGIDINGYPQVCGFTATPGGFPINTTIQPVFGGGAHDAFVTAYNPTNTPMTYYSSTYLGGNGDDRAYDIAVGQGVGPLNQNYVVGYTTSTNFPHFNVNNGINHTVQDAFGGSSDAFMTRYFNSGTSLIWSSTFGGSGEDWASSVAVDSTTGDFAITGKTNSFDFPRVSAYQPNRRGEDDSFVAKIRSNCELADFSTYFGGDGHESGNSVALNAATGDVYVIGTTDSWNFPATIDGMQTGLVGGQNTDAFLARFGTFTNAFLVSQSGMLKYASHFGGDDFDYGNGIAMIGSLGNAVAIAGTTRSGSAFPLVTPLQSEPAGASDAFVSKIDLSSPYFAAGEVTAVSRTPDSIVLSWPNEAKGAVNLEIERTDLAGATSQVAVVDPSVKQYVDSGLAADAEYAYTVYAVGSDGEKVASNLIQAQTLPFAPAAPTGLAVVVDGAKSVLDWTDAATNESGYLVQSLVDGEFATVAEAKAGTTHFETTQVLTDAVETSWRVVAVNRGGESAPSNAVDVELAPTLSVALTAGSLVDGAKPGADKFSVKGAIAGVKGFDPNTQAVRILIGTKSNPVVLSVPAAARGWKVKRDVFSFESSRSFLGGAKFKLDLDAAKGTFALAVSSFEFPVNQANQVFVGFSLGDKAGASQTVWASKGPGKLVLK
jgi:hypothetical protein